MNFLYDHNISWRIPRAIRRLVTERNVCVAGLWDLYPEVRRGVSVSDERWLSELGSEGNWFAITNDRRITRNPELRQVWLAAEIPLFVVRSSVSKSGFGHWRRISWHVDTFKKIREFAELADRTGAYWVPIEGDAFEPVPVHRRPTSRESERRVAPVPDEPLLSGPVAARSIDGPPRS